MCSSSETLLKCGSESHDDNAARLQVLVAVQTYILLESYAICPAVPLAVADDGTDDHERPEPPPLAATSSQVLFPA
jgi:hypothetical protein